VHRSQCVAQPPLQHAAFATNQRRPQHSALPLKPRSLTKPPRHVLLAHAGSDAIDRLSSHVRGILPPTGSAPATINWSRLLRLASKPHCDMSTYIITGYARNPESTTSISRTYRLKASQLTVLQNCCLVRDTKIGYHFYISVLFLLHNELLYYSTLPGFSYMVFTGLTRLYTTMLYTFILSGIPPISIQNGSKSDLTCF
jgi:hypothetical protein